jgi:hypothetical protein
VDDFLFFLIERHLNPMLGIAVDLGDDQVNVTPDLPGANSPFQLIAHCCGLIEWWTREVILGLDVDRDRDGEFTARGTVAELRARVEATKAQLRRDLASVNPDAVPRGRPSAKHEATRVGATVRGVLLHVFEEVAQHHGHLEITRDVVVSPNTR